MMICLPCRRQLLAAALRRARVPKPLHWQIRASGRPASSTASTSTPTKDPYADRGFMPSLDGLDIDESLRTGDRAPNAHRTKPTEGKRESIRFSKMPVARNRNSPKTTNRDAALKLFENVVKHQSAQDRKAEVATPQRDLSPEFVEFYANLGKLRPMMLEKPMEECLDFFLAKLWNKRPEGNNGLLKKRGTYLMNKVAEARIKDFDNERLPSVAQITQWYHDLDSLGSQRWSAMMMGLIKAIIAKSPLRGAYTRDEDFERAIARKEELRNDLVDSWIAFHRHKMSPDNSKLQTSDEAAFRLPEIDVEQLRLYGWKQNYRGALRCIFPNWMKQLTHIPAVAVATFVLLVDPAHSDDRVRQRAKSLLAPIGRVLSACPFGQPALNELLEPYPTVYLYILDKWEMLNQRLHGMRKKDVKGDTAAANVQDGGAEEEDAEDMAHKRDSKTIGTAVAAFEYHAKEGYSQQAITHALGMGDLLALETTWTDFWSYKGAPKDPKKLRPYGIIFNHFIMAFTALKRPERAIDVWDHMTRVVDIPPTLLTWAALVEGCRNAKNAAGLENVWKKMMAWAKKMDQAVDDKVWISRIVGLMESGEPEAGLRALAEMAKLSKTVHGTKVNISVVNAALAGLLRANAPAAAKKALTWASELYEGEDKIEPDIVTYNTLLGPMVAKGESAMIKSTLEMMAANGIKPDAATYTILLEGLINEDLDSVQQALGVHKLLSNMEKDGINATHQTLGRMLHLVLRKGRHTQDHTKGAAGAILEHMLKNGQRLTPHIYTILVDHYFARTPPGLAEIDKLLTQRDANYDGRKRRPDERFDLVLHERIIKGFAAAGETHRAYGEFTKLNTAGAAITLGTLDLLLRSLVENGNNDMAHVVVASIKEQRGMSAVKGSINNSIPAGMNINTKRYKGSQSWERYWKHGFWMYAMDKGLLDPAEWRELRRGTFTQVDNTAVGTVDAGS